MSDPISKAQRSAAKDARQSPAPEVLRQHKKRQRRPKPYRVMGKGFFGNTDRCWHKSATREDAEAWIAKQLRGERDWGFYVVGPEVE